MKRLMFTNDVPRSIHRILKAFDPFHSLSDAYKDGDLYTLELTQECTNDKCKVVIRYHEYDRAEIVSFEFGQKEYFDKLLRKIYDIEVKTDSPPCKTFAV